MTEGSKLLIALLLLKASHLVMGYCPQDKTHNIGHCKFRIRCIGTIRDVSLPAECQGSTNHPVRVDLTLDEAVERFDDNINTEFLNTVDTLRVSAHWPHTSLALVEYMPNLENLYLVGNKIEHITDQPFSRLNNLKNVDLSYNNLTNIDGLFKFASHSKLKRLSLAHNSITDLKFDVFDDLSSLIELDLSYNSLSNLTEEPFSNLKRLQILRLNNNNIKDLNGAINNLTNLKHFYIGGNQLYNIDAESLQVIYHLETFDVSDNDLDKLEPTVFWRHWDHFESNNFINRIKINLSENQIKNVPNATKEIMERFIRDLPKDGVKGFTELDLSKNEISNVAYNAFQTIVQLISLDLSRNKLCDFLVNPNDIIDVKFLNLSNNFIAIMYFTSFSGMKKLHNLDLSNNNLEYIPENTFINNNNLKHVRMGNNSFRKLNRLHIKGFHRSGGILDLSNNGIESLRIPFDEATYLNILILDSNNITDASNIILSHQNDLKMLNLCRNQIQKLDETSLHLPVGLAFIDFSFNMIHEIGPSTFRYVSHLDTLKLSHNNLTSLSYGTFHGLKELKNLDLSYNNIRHLDSKVLTDLKLLQVLYLKYNDMVYLDYKGWLGRKSDLKVFVDGNNFTCEWLGTALRNFENGYCKVRPMVSIESTVGHSIEGIPCVLEQTDSENHADMRTASVDADERLLLTTQKILEEMREENSLLKKLLWQSLRIYDSIERVGNDHNNNNQLKNKHQIRG